jgi:hypothetical protein
MRAKHIIGGTGLAAAFLWMACAAAPAFQTQQPPGADDPAQEQDTVKQRAKKLLEQLEAQKKQIEVQLRSQLEQLEVQKKHLLEQLDRHRAAAEEAARKQLQQLEETRKRLPELIQRTVGERLKPVEGKPASSLD